MKPIYDLLYAKRPGEEIYDLQTDPDQMHNLADDPAFPARLDRTASGGVHPRRLRSV